MRLLDWLRRLVTPAPPPAAPPVTPTGDAVVDLLSRHNMERAYRGLPLLALDPAVTRAAARHAADMAAGGFLGHTGRDGALLDTRLRRAGVGFTSAAENVAAGHLTAAAAVAAWMASTGHRANVLGPYTRVGFGVARGADGQLYWCADFAG